MIGQLLELALGVGLEVARESSLKKDFIPSAVEIARYQGWVSPHRMSSQLGLGRRDAQLVLFAACNRGLLYQAVNGRYYVAASPLQNVHPIVIDEEPARFEGIAALPAVAEVMPAGAEQRSGNGRGILVVVCLVVSFGIGVALILNGRRTASLPVAPSIPVALASPRMMPRAPEVEATGSVKAGVAPLRPAAPAIHQTSAKRHRHPKHYSQQIQ